MLLNAKKYFLFCLLLLANLFLQAQPFADEIAAFKKADSIQPPPKHAILFAGSSSFRLWKNLPDYFPGKTIVNRGFGGSSIPDMIRYANDIIFPYQPRQIVIYCGENDLSANDTIQTTTTVEHFKTLFQLIRSRLPDVSVVYVSIKPSPVRKKYWNKMRQANLAIKRYLRKQRNTAFADIYGTMLNDDGSARTELYINDQLHMNESGYKIWQKIISPYLKNE